MKRLLLIVLPLLLMVGCETKISGPIETIPEVTGVQLEWIGYLPPTYATVNEGIYYYYGTVWYTNLLPNTLSSYPSVTITDGSYDYDKWHGRYPVTEIELFQSQGYFNYKYMDGGVEVVQSNFLTDNHFWIEK
jgi:hypothetical protein